MIVLGIDPGLAHMGYGLIEIQVRKSLVHREHGSYSTKPQQAHLQRLKALADFLEGILQRFPVDVVAMESLFFSSLTPTIFPVAEARGALLLVLARQGLECFDYSPREVKQFSALGGGISKHLLADVVCKLLKLEEAPQSSHASDALAVALCHIHHQGLY